MAVPVSQRNESRFEAEHHFYQLRSDVTELIFTDFGYSSDKYSRMIDRYRDMHRSNPNCEDVVGRMSSRRQSFDDWFIDQERDTVMYYLRMIQMEFTVGNSIYPSNTIAKFMEYFTRRYHINNAIGYCFALKQEINYIIRALPVNVGKYQRFSDSIDEQIRLYKGVRGAGNKLLKGYMQNKDDDGTSVYDALMSVFDGISDLCVKVCSPAQKKND
ncbi:MAG: hypothetical protein IJT44_00125 [Clostridia bacterium]|nr:hypothetical protein [Clostridia bacterium]